MHSPATPRQLDSSSLLLSAGAPTFGGGASFETLDFSLPSYDQAVTGDVAPSKPATKDTSNDDAAAAKAAEKAAKEEAMAAEKAAKEDAKRAAAEKKEGGYSFYNLHLSILDSPESYYHFTAAERAEKAAAEAKKQEEEDAKAAKQAEKAARIVSGLLTTLKSEIPSHHTNQICSSFNHLMQYDNSSVLWV